MARKAVAATLASVLLFTALVVADSTIMAAQDNLASSAQVSNIESRELVLGQSSAGSAALQVLAQVQSFLASNPADCASLAQYLASVSASGSASGEDSGIAYASNVDRRRADRVSKRPVPDNLTDRGPVLRLSRQAPSTFRRP